MNPKIERGIPIPPRYTSFYNWHEMQIGDSRLFNDGRSYNAIKCIVCRATNQTGFTFTLRKLREGVRVWRIE